jgi:hypothetical protein
MSLETLKKLQLFVGFCITGIVVCFVMTIETAVQRHRAEAAIDTSKIPVPAAVSQ